LVIEFRVLIIHRLSSLVLRVIWEMVDVRGEVGAGYKQWAFDRVEDYAHRVILLAFPHTRVRSTGSVSARYDPFCRADPGEDANAIVVVQNPAPPQEIRFRPFLFINVL
jgi:hypothetical protein